MSTVRDDIVLTPNTDREKRRAAVWACAQVLATTPPGQQHAEALELLRALGLAPDPHAIHLHPVYRTRPYQRKEPK